MKDRSSKTEAVPQAPSAPDTAPALPPVVHSHNHKRTVVRSQTDVWVNFRRSPDRLLEHGHGRLQGFADASKNGIGGRLEKV